MTDERLAELKAAWPGEWRNVGYACLIDVMNVTVAAFWSVSGNEFIVWVDDDCTLRSARGCKTLTEAVASFRAEADRAAQVYAALAGKTLV